MAKRNSHRTTHRRSSTGPKLIGRTRPQPRFESEPDPAAVNHDHPDRPRARKTVPGAGIVHAAANASDKSRSRGPLLAPGARHADTTFTTSTAATEDAETLDRSARSSGVRAIADPNFPIAHAKRSPGRQAGRRAGKPQKSTDRPAR